MKSFALWCDAKNAGESTGVKVLMNFNLWAEAEKGESHTVLDVGVMLIPEEKSSKRKQICEVVKSISFYCPFPLEKKNFENLFPKMDNKTVGAIFNSPCNYTKNDIYSVGYVTLYGDDAYPKFAIRSCDNVQFEEIDDKGTIVKIMLTNTMFPPESDREYEPIYYRFRLSGMFVSNLVASSHSKDWLLTSAFSREEVIDFRFNDYRPLDDERIIANIYGKNKDCVRINEIKVHFLLMSLMSIDVNSDSNEGKGRRLLEKDIWNDYAPCVKDFDNVAAWHWTKKLEKNDGYKINLMLRRHICNWKTIVLYILVLFVIDCFFNFSETVIMSLPVVENLLTHLKEALVSLSLTLL